MSLKKFRNDIQGLRAIAVLTVVIFHAWPAMLPGGFIGVDMFFVISGFLIGDIIYRDITNNSFSLLDFYRKRVRRIFPALFVMLVFTLFIGFFVLSPVAFKELGRTTVSATLFLSNVDFTLFSGYFDSVAETRPLLHTWSLSVEEQFYIFYPLILMAIVRWLPYLLLPIIGVSVVLLAGLSEWAIHQFTIAGYFLSPYRAFELLIGAFAAYAPSPKGKQTFAASAGLITIILSLVNLTPDSMFPGLNAMFPTVGVALVLWAGRAEHETLVSRLLSVPPMMFFGAISYSLYLWHWPILAYLRILVPDHPSDFLIACAFFLSVLSGWLSWKFVEQRFASAPVRRAPILISGVSGLVLMSLVGTFVWAQAGFPSRFPQKALDYFAAAQDYSPWRESCHQDDDRRVLYRDTCVLGGAEGTAPELAVWADSHGTELAAAIANTMPVRQITASACPPVVGVDVLDRTNCRAANGEIFDSLLMDRSIKTVVLALNRDAYATQDQEALQAGFKNVVQALEAEGKTVVVLQQIPIPDMDAPAVAGMAQRWGDEPKLRTFNWSGAINAAVWAEFEVDLAKGKGVRLFDPTPVLCNAGECPLVADDRVVFFDHSHVSMAGAERIAASLLDVLDDTRVSPYSEYDEARRLSD